MIDCYIGIKCGFDINVGNGKYKYSLYLSEKELKLYKETYSCYQKENIESSFFASISIFDKLAIEVSSDFDYKYESSIKNDMLNFLKTKLCSR